MGVNLNFLETVQLIPSVTLQSTPAVYTTCRRISHHYFHTWLRWSPRPSLFCHQVFPPR